MHTLSILAPPNPPTNVIAKRSDPTTVNVSWTAPSTGNPVIRYHIHYIANGGESTRGGSTTSTSYVLTNLQAGVPLNISVSAVGAYLPSYQAFAYVT